MGHLTEYDHLLESADEDAVRDPLPWRDAATWARLAPREKLEAYASADEAARASMRLLEQHEMQAQLPPLWLDAALRVRASEAAQAQAAADAVPQLSVERAAQLLHEALAGLPWTVISEHQRERRRLQVRLWLQGADDWRSPEPRAGGA